MNAQALVSSGTSSSANPNMTASGTNAPTGASTTTCHLMRLPAEVFNQIAELALQEKTVRVSHRRHSSRRSGGLEVRHISELGTINTGHDLSLLFVNKFYNKQFTAMAYSKIKFIFETPESFELFFNLYRHMFRFLRDVTLDFFPLAYNINSIEVKIGRMTSLARFSMTSATSRMIGHPALTTVIRTIFSVLQPMFLREARNQKTTLKSSYRRRDVTKILTITAEGDPLRLAVDGAIRSVRYNFDRMLERRLEQLGL